MLWLIDVRSWRSGGVQHANVQTEEDDPGPIRERVICIPSGARPTSCTPVIVPFKATRKGGKAVRKRTAKVKKARPDEGQGPASSTPARRQVSYGRLVN